MNRLLDRSRIFMPSLKKDWVPRCGTVMWCPTHHHIREKILTIYILEHHVAVSNSTQYVSTFTKYSNLETQLYMDVIVLKLKF